MFGQRSLGGSPRRRTSSLSANRLPGLSTSGKRFVRGNRRGGFVGSDRNDRRQFVGRNDTGSTRQVRSAVTGVRTNQNSASANPALQRPTAGKMYLPKLEISPELQIVGESVEAREFDISIALSARLSQATDSPIEVSVANRIATIRGVVVSAKDRRRAEILASFEPGVSSVVNVLQLAADSEVRSTVPPDPVPTPAGD